MVSKNRINFEPTAISASNADGSVSELDIAVYSEIAKGGYGMINIGGYTPDSKTGRVTVTGIIIDDDNMIPGLAKLAIWRAQAAGFDPMQYQEGWTIYSAEALHSRPYKYPVKVFESSTLDYIDEKEVTIIDKNLKRIVIEADDIVTCYTKSNIALDDVFDKVEATRIPVITIGDARGPGNLLAAVKEGALFSSKLDPDYCIKNPN